MFETTEHFFGDAVDIEYTETGELVTVPRIEYDYLSRTMTDAQIFEVVSQEIENFILKHFQETGVWLPTGEKYEANPYYQVPKPGSPKRIILGMAYEIDRKKEEMS